ncbi:hypothetical protein ACFSTD_21515 [Novosphingobium colocasiae]
MGSAGRFFRAGPQLAQITGSACLIIDQHTLPKRRIPHSEAPDDFRESAIPGFSQVRKKSYEDVYPVGTILDGVRWRV